MTTARDAQIRVGLANSASEQGPHFATSRGEGSGLIPPVSRLGGKRPLPPWRRVVRKGLVLAGLIGLGFLVPPQRDARKVDTDADAERASFDVLDGFEVNLFAADPLLAKPTQMNFDARGRLWVACSEAYPQIKPDQPANDKIVVLEDSDGDGVAEKAEVFADGLLIPTGVEPGDGGAYVANGTELLHFRDRDGDGKADERRVVLSGFGTEDTHHIIHTLRWGPDGALYFNQSVYIHSNVETPWGVQRLAGGGIWRFQPESQWLTVFARGWVNAWGHAFDRWGQSLVTDGAGGQGINHAIPGGAYASAVGVTRILPGLNPGSPKFAGAEVLSGRHLPDDWQGSILTDDFRANNVRRFALSDDGSTLTSRPEADLIRTRYQAFRPIDIKMGPDGAIYIADWYNPIINHGEVDFRDPRRDHTRGRIWRVTAKNRPLVPRPQLAEAAIPDLLGALKAPEGWTRHFARRVLKDRGKAAVEAPLRAWVAGLDPDDPNTDHHRLEALWLAESLGLVAPDLLDPVLNARDPHARAAAVRVVEHWLGRIDDPFGRLAPRVLDDDPRVRLEAVRALGHAPEARAAEIALRALDKPVDPTLDFALFTTLRDLQPFWHQALAEGRFDLGGDARKLVYALEAISSKDAIRPLVAALRDGKIGAAEEDRARTLIAAQGGPDDLALILDLALDSTTLDARRAGLLAPLAEAAGRRGVQPSGDLARLGRLLGSDQVEVQAAAIRLVGAWKFEPLRDRIAEVAATPSTRRAARAAALRALASLGGDASVATLDRLAARSSPLAPADRLRAAANLARLDLDRAAARAAEGLADLTTAPPESDLVTVFQGFLDQRGGAEALTRALSDSTLDAGVAELAGRIATRLGGGTDSKLVPALNRAGGLVASTDRKTWPSAERAAILLDVARRGDPARGEAIFRRGGLQCLGCHAIAGAGGRVGPGLESLGASAPVDYLLDSLVEPNKAVKEGYHATVVATQEGRVVTGIKVGQTDSALLLRNAEDREVSIPLATIDEQKSAGSLMPSGLVDGLTRAEVVDLVRFLSELGKLGPYAVSPQLRLARRWEVAHADQPLTRPIATALDDPALTWSPAYSTVAGLLPTSDLPTVPTQEGPIHLVRTGVEVATAGPVRLELSPASSTVWLDGHRLEPGPGGDRVTDLATGAHVVTLAIPKGTSPSTRLELRDVPNSPAQARPTLGK